MLWHLAQVNIGIVRAPLDTLPMADFKNGLETVNALAESHEGFVWRLVDDSGANATALRPFEDERLINMSVWTSLEALRSFVYRSGHKTFLARRAEWFAPMQGAMMALWWIRSGDIPTIDDARHKLELLNRDGPTAAAFTFAKSFPSPFGED
jgi:hypothetical protein